MTELARKLVDGSIRRVLGMVLAFLFVLGGLESHAAVYALNVTPGTNSAWDADAIGYNGKMQGNPWRTDPFNDSNLIDVLSRSMIGTFRFPGGTLANYYDWVNGQDNRKAPGFGHYVTSNLKLAYDGSGFIPTYTINILTGTLQEALDGLAQAQTDGLPVTLVEMGNEFYLSDTDYVNAFPTGVEYGQKCQTWITSIKNQFPGVKCAIVVTMKTGTRTTTWSDEVFSACTNYDSVVVHWYEESALEPAVVNTGTTDGTQAEQDTQWTAFNAADGPEIMLAQPNNGWELLRANNDLPANVDIWVTEFNLKDSNGAVRQTWANGLFNANQIHELLQDGRVSRIYLHNWLSSNKQAIFGLNNELDYVLTSHGQGSLATTPYEFGAPGQVVRLYAEVMTGATTIEPLNIETSPKVSPAGYLPYDAIYGWRFTEGANNRAILVNTSSTAYEIQTAGIAPAGSHMRQLSGDPHTYVTGENATLNYATAGEMPPVLRLPAYSVTTIGAVADTAPSGGSPNAPAFSGNPIVKPATTAYEYYTQSLMADASDADGDLLTFKKVSGPAWAIVWSDGMLAGTPDNGDTGLNQVVVEVIDAGGLTAQTTIEFTVNAGTPPPPPPIAPQTYGVAEDNFVYSGAQADIVQTLDDRLDIRSTASASFSRVPYIKFDVDVLPGTVSNAVLNFYSIDVNAQVITYATATGWSASTITWNNQPGFGTPIATNTVAAGWNQIDITDQITGVGIYSFAFDEQSNSRKYLSSSRGSNPAYIEVTFESAAPPPANNAPVFTSNPVVEINATENAAYSSTITDNATDADSDPLTFSSISGPAWLSVASSGALSGTPGAVDVGLNNWTVQVSDGTDTDTATLNITVDAPPNNPPFWSADPFTQAAATEDSPYSKWIKWRASDPESDPMTFSKVSGPAWASVAANGQVTGTPVQGDVGPGVFVVSVSDGINPAVEATMNLEVLNTNDAPVFAVDPINKPDANEGAAYSDTINGSASDQDNDPLTYSKISGPAWLSIAADGTLSGTPGAGDAGLNAFTVQVADGNGGTDTAILNITVIAAPIGWTDLSYDDFEAGWGSYQDGGSDCRRSANDSSFAHQGTYCVRIRDNSSSSLFDYTNGVDVNAPGYTQIKVDFWFRASSMESGENFWVQYWDGSTWQTVANYVRGTDFENGSFYHIDNLVINESSYTFPTDMKIRFRCDATANNDKVYIDEVRVSAQ